MTKHDWRVLGNAACVTAITPLGVAAFSWFGMNLWVAMAIFVFITRLPKRFRY